MKLYVSRSDKFSNNSLNNPLLPNDDLTIYVFDLISSI